MGGGSSLTLGEAFPLGLAQPRAPRGVGCSECLSCPQSSEASSWDAGQRWPLFLSLWFLQGSRGSPAASTLLQAREAGQDGNVCVPSHSQRLGRIAPPRTSEVGSSASAGGGRWVPPLSTTTWRPAGFSPPPLSFPPPQGGQPWQATRGRRAGLSFNQCRCHICCASEPRATSEALLTQGSRRPLPPGQN